MTSVYLFMLCLGASAVLRFGLPSFALSAAGEIVVLICEIVGILALLLVFSQVLFNQPKMMAPKALRNEPGVAVVAFRRLFAGNLVVDDGHTAFMPERQEAWGATADGLRAGSGSDPGEPVIYRRRANRRQTELRWVGGTLFLTESRLYFKPNRVDRAFNGADWELDGKLIASADRFTTPENQFRDVLKIISADGAVDLFVVNQLDKFVHLIDKTFWMGRGM